MAKLCAWIDLGVPHSGTYTDDMQPEAAELYLQRLATRTQHEAVEAQNIAAFIAAGGYPISIDDRFYGKKPGQDRLSNIRLIARFSRTNRRLTIKVPSEGTITLVDLRGRRVLSLPVSRDAFLKDATVSMQVTITPGLYIVNFSGSSGTTRRIISTL